MTDIAKSTIALLPGQTREITSGKDDRSGDCGIELGLTQTSSLYVGELAVATLVANSIPEEVARAHKGWWVALIEAGRIKPIAFTAPTSEGDEARLLIEAVGGAIRAARASARLAALPDGGRYLPLKDGVPA